MEHAIWIKKSGEEEYVSIHKIKNDLGEAKARQERYKCHSKKCGVAMIPIFPKKVRRNAKEVHSDHFRGAPIKHKPECGGGDRKIENAADSDTGDKTNTKRRYDAVRRGAYPVHYRRSRVTRDVRGGEIAGRGRRPERGERAESKGRGTRDGRHTSEPGTAHIRRIVEAYEHPPEELSQMKIDIPGCIARNYADAFVAADKGVDERGIVKGYYIYKGPYGGHHSYFSGGLLITFNSTSGDGRKLGVWIKPRLEPDASRQEIREMLKRADRDKNATVYALGRFRLFDEKKYSIDLEAFGDLWITFPASSS